MSEVSAEQLVAQRVDSLSQHMAENRFDVIASIAVDAMQKDGLVPVAAFLHATKAAFCNYEIAVRTMTQLQSQRMAADQGRADAAFEHGKRMQAERKAEKLEADLAQSVLLVENQRLRLDEARAQGSSGLKWCRRIRELENSLQERLQELQRQDLKLETAEAALLEQQQRNEELVTQGSQQHMKIAELQRQFFAVKTQELPAKTQELPAELSPPDGWRPVPLGEPLRGGDDYHQGLDRYIRRIEPEPQPEPAVQGGLVRDVTHYLEESGVLDLALSRGDDSGGN